MVKKRTFVGALLGVAVLGSSAVVAHAGGGGFGGGPLGDVVLTDCYQIVSGGNAPYTMDVNDPFGERQNIKVGQLQMVCVVSGAWSRQNGVSQPPLNGSFDPGQINAATCYQVTEPGDQGPGAVGTVVDLFGSQTAVLKRMSMLCSPANLLE
jgi:hypothetical protein